MTDERPTLPGPGLRGPTSARPLSAWGTDAGRDGSTNGPPRSIMHVDMDAFFAAVEVKEQPSLSGLPVVVGGSGPRGVVASASYEARAFGVRSAMPGPQARRMCPDLVVLAPRFDQYLAYSHRLHEVLRSFTPLVEGLGLDEAFLDVTNAAGLFGPPDNDGVAGAGAGGRRARPRLFRRGRAEQVGGQIGFEGGQAPGLQAGATTRPGGSRHWPGRGTRFPLAHAGRSRLGSRAGRCGPFTPARGFDSRPAGLPASGRGGHRTGKVGRPPCARSGLGRDPRPVLPDRPVKSIGHEETYPVDVVERKELERRLVVMADSVATRVRRDGSVARTVTVKLRYGDFTTLTRSHTFERPQTSGPSLWSAAKALLASLDLKSGVRLLGLSASGLVPVGVVAGRATPAGIGLFEPDARDGLVVGRRGRGPFRRDRAELGTGQ